MPPVRDLGRGVLQLATKYGGMEAADMRLLRQLEEENRRLKSIVADQAVDIGVFKDVLAKNGPK